MERSRSAEWSTLRGWCRDTARLELGHRQVDQLRAFVDTLCFWNRRMALVSRRDEGQLILKHVADALFAASQCPTDRAVIDIGSGAGFPGLPIAIAHPGSGVCLLESRAKKISFLLEAIRAVGALNAFTYHGRLEGAGRDEAHRGRYSVAIARALARPETALHAARPFLIPGGRAMIMISAAQAEQPGAVSEIISYRLPDGTPRALLVRVSRATPHPS